MAGRTAGSTASEAADGRYCLSWQMKPYGGAGPGGHCPYVDT